MLRFNIRESITIFFFFEYEGYMLHVRSKIALAFSLSLSLSFSLSLGKRNQTFPEDMGARFGTDVSFFCRGSFIRHFAFYRPRLACGSDYGGFRRRGTHGISGNSTRSAASNAVANGRGRTKISGGRCSFCSAEFAVRMRRANDDARRAFITS